MMLPILLGATLEMFQTNLHLHFPIILFHAETSFGAPNEPPQKVLLRSKLESQNFQGRG